MAGNRHDHLRQHWARMQDQIVIQHPHQYNGIGYSPDNRSPRAGADYSPGRDAPIATHQSTEDIKTRQLLNWSRRSVASRHSGIYEDETEDYGSEPADSWRPMRIKSQIISGNEKISRNSGQWMTKSQEILNKSNGSRNDSSYLQDARATEMVSPNRSGRPLSVRLPGFTADSDDDCSTPQSVFEEEKRSLNKETRKMNQSNNADKNRQRLRKSSIYSSDDEFQYHATSTPLKKMSNTGRSTRKISEEHLLYLQQYPNQGKLTIRIKNNKIKFDFK